MYTDDLMKSKSTTEEAIALVSQLRELLARGGFRLTKWYSNESLLVTIPECERTKSVENLDLKMLPTETALGLKWNIEENKFVWEDTEKMLQRVSQEQWHAEELCQLFTPSLIHWDSSNHTPWKPSCCCKRSAERSWVGIIRQRNRERITMEALVGWSPEIESNTGRPLFQTQGIC